MSQAKVDKYKEEKKNRAKQIKKKRRKKLVTIFVLAGMLGAIIGYPLGKVLYKKSVEKREASATIVAGSFDYWSQQYWAANYAGIVDFSALDSDGTATSTDATSSDDTHDHDHDHATSIDAE